MPEKVQPAQDSIPALAGTRNITAQSIDSEMQETSTKSPENAPAPSKEQTASEAFDEYYLRQVTAEFADDIEKLRNASDFKESSVPVLIQALKQGAANFTEEEKRRAMGSGKGG